jgi:hypothetical protein
MAAATFSATEHLKVHAARHASGSMPAPADSRARDSLAHVEEAHPVNDGILIATDVQIRQRSTNI